uniref:Uncharacterized protein n=1 Tax=Quercus lobata TaxID=97700 RepID=A0A7N2KQI5_QUELO
MLAVKLGSLPLAMGLTQTKKCRSFRVLTGTVKLVPGLVVGFYPFFTRRLRKIKYPFARTLAWRMERLPVQTVVVDLQEKVQKDCTFGMKHNFFSPYEDFPIPKLDCLLTLLENESG